MARNFAQKGARAIIAYMSISHNCLFKAALFAVLLVSVQTIIGNSSMAF
jgi:hypothetical protein